MSLIRPNFLVLAAMMSVALYLPLGAIEPGQKEAVTFEQRIGAMLPLAAEFTDAVGQRHALRDYFQGQPVVLYFGYARCPQLCSVIADGTVAALRQVRPEVGKDLAVVSISLDPGETTAENARRRYDAVHRYGRPGDPASGWNFLTGSEESIGAVTSAAGFHYAFDPVSRQYAHPSGFLVASPDGRIAAYFLGVDFLPADVARAIAQARDGRASPPVFQLLLLCFRGDGIGGRYGPLIWRVLAVSVGLTVVAVGGGIGWMLRTERRAMREGQEEKP